MKKAFQFLTIFGIGSFLASCSCGIFREEFVPESKRSKLTEATTKQVAIKNGFSERTGENGYARYRNKDIEFLYHDCTQVVVVRSSLCPLFSMPLAPAEWQSRCESMSTNIMGSFKDLGISMRKLSPREQIEHE